MVQGDSQMHSKDSRFSRNSGNKKIFIIYDWGGQRKWCLTWYLNIFTGDGGEEYLMKGTEHIQHWPGNRQDLLTQNISTGACQSIKTTDACIMLQNRFLKILSSQSSHKIGINTIKPILQREKLSLEKVYFLAFIKILKLEKGGLRPKDSISKSHAITNVISSERKTATLLRRARSSKPKYQVNGEILGPTMVEWSSPSVKVTRYDLLCLLSFQTGADYSLATTFPFLRGTARGFIAVA